MRATQLLAAAAATFCLCAPARAQVQVTPDAGSVSHLAGTAPTDLFVVRNTGGASTTYTLQGECSGTGVSDCVASRPAVTLAAGDSALVGVSYFFPGGGGGLGGGSSVVRLKAFRSDLPVVRDSGDVQVSEDMSLAQPAGMRLDRDDCVVAAAGPGAFECGDLRLGHALPSTRVLGTARTPTLLYNSQHARPFPLIPFTVTPTLTGSPFVHVSEVRATLQMGGTVMATRNWLVNLSTTYSTDIAAPLYRFAIGFDASSLATGVHDYTLAVTVVYSNGNEETEGPSSGQLVVVNRAASPFGAGWWMAGLESLSFPTGDGSQVLWVGGDGSYRLYHRVATNTWVPDAWDRPDTLRYQPDSLQYVRTLPGRVEVRFDQLGRHVRTRNKAGHWSTFEWSGSQLTRIHLPRTASFNTGYSYLFEYNNTGGKLSRVVAPGTGREVTFAMSSGRITSIAGPDTTAVGFTYSGTSPIPASRTDRRGISTTFTFDPGQRLTRVTNTMGTAGTGDDLSIGFTPAETMPYFDGVLADSVFTEIDGPRPDTDVVDKTRFYVSETGVPRQVRNALSYVTTVVRGDARWPGLVTEVFTPYGRTSVEGYRRTSASYDARGNLLSSTDWGTVSSNGRPAVTLYAWDPYWDEVTEVTAPEGGVTRTSYNALGQVQWTQPGIDPGRRVNFTYVPMTSATAPGLVASATLPAPATGGASATEQYAYDARGNLSSVTSPLGFQSLTLSDAVGRVLRTQAPIDSAQTAFAIDSTVYDAMDRVVHTESFARSATVAPTQWLIVDTNYDRTGNALSVSRRSVPDTAHIGTTTTSWVYDAAGRKVAEIAPDGARDSTVYDAAGNAVRVRNRRYAQIGAEITAVYDALNRQVARRLPGVVYNDTTSRGWTFPRYANCFTTKLCLPADTATYAYDVAGNLLAADNRDARVRRSYDPAGRMVTDSLRTRTSAERSAGGDFDQHAYGLRLRYDTEGRRTALIYPQQLAARFAAQPWVAYDSVAYGYAPTGELASVRDVLGNQFGYLYDLQGRLDRVTYPRGHFKQYVYDADGRVLSTTEDTTATGGSVSRFSFRYDARGHAISATPLTSVSEYGPDINGYSGLGALIAHDQQRPFRDAIGPRYDYERWTLDALGNQALAQSSFNYHFLTSNGPTYIYGTSSTWNTYATSTGRLTNVRSATGSMSQLDYAAGCQSFVNDTVTRANRYDAAGNQTFVTAVWQHYGNGVCFGTPSYDRDSAAINGARYYDAESRLRATDNRGFRNSSSRLGQDPPGFEEYRYDALGRRILRRGRNTPGLALADSARFDLIQRFVWDGSALAAEIQSPGSNAYAAVLERDTVTVGADGEWFGRVLYLAGSGIDQPLSVVRIGYGKAIGSTYRIWDPIAFTPHWDHQGRAFEDVVYGPTPRCQTVGSTTGCFGVHWPARLAYGLYTPSNVWPHQVYGGWFGSLAQDQLDGTGQLYRRNRYYDAQSGRFTQEDPIGLAGGLNAYGFADGNPISFSDPYGLKGMAQIDDSPPRIRRNVFFLRGVTPGAPPASCDCDAYSRIEYEPLTVSEAADYATGLGYLNAGKSVLFSALIHATGLEIPWYISLGMGGGMGVIEARKYSPQNGDQITVTTTEKFNEEGERVDRKQTTVVRRSDGTVLQF